MKITMDRREKILLPKEVLEALEALEKAILTTDWRGTQVTMTRHDDFEMNTVVDVQMKGGF
jgi:hypothetical protein